MENMKSTETLAKYDKLIEEIIVENELARQSSDLDKLCKIGLRKLRLTKEFAQIDEKILEVSGSDSSTSDFFSEILYFESKRLTFKEEALKCESSKIRMKI